ncbi:MAG: hypothetical protein JO117_07065, partial [Verrucomicrobia bacterium]|nr:hypothetical protein [Verrucomicrobiota bacterium]
RKARHEAAPIAYRLTLADVNKPTLPRATDDDKKKKKAADEAAAPRDPEEEADDEGDSIADSSAGGIDPVRSETLNILQDLIRQQLSRRPEIARTTRDAAAN